MFKIKHIIYFPFIRRLIIIVNPWLNIKIIAVLTGQICFISAVRRPQIDLIFITRETTFCVRW